ncbi:MAG: hypothetical protein LBS61_03815 [Endomicrobium sp.]|jgi:hypothetical protein|nr:hypothetical protein [Endomicrobium sp.]
MFYNKKYLFFIIAYLMNLVLCFFINSHFIFSGIDFNLILGSVIIYGIILIFCFVDALTLLYSVKFFRWIFKLKTNNFATKFLWNVFAGLVYLLMVIIFIKVTEY